jgi:hypothetical protein
MSTLNLDHQNDLLRRQLRFRIAGRFQRQSYRQCCSPRRVFLMGPFHHPLKVLPPKFLQYHWNLLRPDHINDIGRFKNRGRHLKR